MSSSKSSHKKLSRSQRHQIIAGVAGGLADFFDLDPTLVRVVFILLAFYQGIGILLYLVLWLLLPTSSTPKKSSQTNPTVSNLVSNLRPLEVGQRKLGFFLVILGLFLLLNNFQLISWEEIAKYWPLTVIFFGLYLFFHHERN